VSAMETMVYGYLITRQLITDLFRTYLYQRQATTRTWWKLRLSHNISDWNVESLWSGGRGALQEQQTQSKVGILSASAFSVPPSDIVNFCTGDRKRSSSATCVISTMNFWCITFCPKAMQGTKSARAKHSWPLSVKGDFSVSPCNCAPFLFLTM